MRLPVILSDGGRAAAGFDAKRAGGDCFPRAVCNAVGVPSVYADIWQACADMNAKAKESELFGTADPSQRMLCGKRNLDNGTLMYSRTLVFMRQLGFKETFLDPWTVLKLDSFAETTGRYVVILRAHATALVGGCIVDAYDPQNDPETQRYGVYGFWEYLGA